MENLSSTHTNLIRTLRTGIAIISYSPIYNLWTRHFSKTARFSSKCPSDENKCTKSLPSPSKNPCESRNNVEKNVCNSTTKNPCKNITVSSIERCKESTTISRADSEVSRYSSSALDDPCSRACKISPSPVCCPDSCSKEKKCPEPPLRICAPTKEIAGKARFWRSATLFGALPFVLIASIVILKRAEEEAKKPRPEFVPMDYMYIRTKRFPWGDGNHTLFHNPEKNAVPPDGYEVEDPNAVKGQSN